MEEFSQSRGDDDLFDDEIVPIRPSAPVPTETVAQKLEQVSLSPPAYSYPTTHNPQASSDRGRGRGRAAQSRGAPSRGRGLADSRFAPRDPLPPAAEPTIPEATTIEPSADSGTPTTDPPIPTAPATKPRPPAVRGDRSSTGGFQKPQLTEEQLTAKLLAAKQKSQEKAAAHARAQADKESFDEREKVARVRREKEESRRKELEGEREKNRSRKMAAHLGREWDREKLEGGGQREESRWEERARERERGRGEQEDLREYVWDESRERGRGRGRGRERGRGRGRVGRGGYANGANGREERLDVAAEDVFPALPGGSAKTTEQKPQDQGQSKTQDSLPAGTTSWADQVEVERADKVKW